MVGAPLEYHDEKGFILPFVTDEVKGRYKCIGERKGNKLEEVEIFVGFLRAFDTLNKPHIVANKTFVVIGDYVELDCTLLEESDIDVWTKWTVPEKVNKDYEPTNDSKIISENGTGVTIRHFHNRLVLRNVGLDHTGDYTCAYIEKYKNNINSVKYHMNVHPKATTFLNLTCKDAPVKTAPPSTTEQRITVRINANPRVDKVNWYFINWKEEKIEIFYVRKYKNESFHENYETLIISSPELNDSGIYRLVASNRVISSSIDIKFYVEAKPHILKPLNLLNDNGLREYSGGSYLLTDYASHHEISCLSIGYPKPTVSWYFQELSDFSSVIGDKRHKIPSFYYRTVENNNSFDIITDSILKGESLRSGILYCNSCNILGCQETSTEFFVTDVKNGFETWGRPYDLIGGDNGTIYCGASKFLFGPALKWSYKFQSQQHDLTLLNDSNIFITNTETELSYISTMVMRNVSTNMTGSYTCEAESLSEKSKTKG
ncbi:vascular endothelial growth factor receptor kdr-like [Nilaparvata lugens]|uniref:vascular endothelial growth factor receptor kdr-like n=1 Tax=Nilaparvata lugens TaxID=108931 RepID=UPI00193CFB7B|nr:vascular endothelial growth factor receptor kdr-like [Nilaparvata lugens]